MTDEELKWLHIAASAVPSDAIKSHDDAEWYAKWMQEFWAHAKPNLILELLAEHNKFRCTLHQIAGMDTAAYSETNMDFIVQTAKAALK